MRRITNDICGTAQINKKACFREAFRFVELAMYRRFERRDVGKADGCGVAGKKIPRLSGVFIGT